MSERNKLALIQMGLALLVAYSVHVRAYEAAAFAFSFQVFYLLMSIAWAVSKTPDPATERKEPA